MMPYLAWKLLHLAGIVLWIGPPLGAFWMQIWVLCDLSPEMEIRFRRAFAHILTIEHIGLAFLISGAAGMVLSTGVEMLDVFWMKGKLALFLCVIIPMEILDIWWGQAAVFRVLRGATDSVTDEMRVVFRRYDLFTKICVPFLLVSWAGFFYLAVFKPA